MNEQAMDTNGCGRSVDVTVEVMCVQFDTHAEGILALH